MMFRFSTVVALSFMASSTAYASGSMTGTTKDEMVPSSKKKKASSSYGFKIENFVSYDKRVLKGEKKEKAEKWAKKKKNGLPTATEDGGGCTNEAIPGDMGQSGVYTCGDYSKGYCADYTSIANACCMCGGGITKPPTNAPTNSPTFAPTNAPTSPPTNPGSIDVSNLGVTVTKLRF